MKKRWNNRYVKWGSTVVIVFCTCLLFYYLLFYGSNIKAAINSMYTVLMPILFGCIMAYLLTPTLNWIELKILFPIIKKINIKNVDKVKPYIRALSIVLTSLFYYLIIQIIISMLLSQIVPSIQNIIDNFENYWNNFLAWLHDVFSKNPKIEEYITNFTDTYSEEIKTYLNETALILSKSGELIKTVSLSVFNIFKVLWNFVLGFIIAIYLLSNKEKYANQAKKNHLCILGKR